MAVLRDLALDEQVAGFPRNAMLSAKIAVLDNAVKLPDIALGISLWGTGELRVPTAVEAFPATETPGKSAKA